MVYVIQCLSESTETLMPLAATKSKIVATFRGMRVSPAKHSYGSVTDGRTDRQTTDKVILMCRYVSQATQKQHYLKNMVSDILVEYTCTSLLHAKYEISEGSKFMAKVNYFGTLSQTDRQTPETGQKLDLYTFKLFPD